MREILFRGKRTDNSEWVYGWFEMFPFVRWPVKASIIPSEDAIDGSYEHVEVIPETVGQFTGLTDKNGTKIFEGDIWKRGDVCGVVRWDDEEARFIVAYEIGGIEYQNAVSERRMNTIEIIGTIHDNPELLEGGAEDDG